MSCDHDCRRDCVAGNWMANTTEDAIADAGNMSIEAQELLGDALERRWQEYSSRFKSCRRELSESNVHDLRVSARRLLAALDVAHGLEAGLRGGRASRLLKRLIKNLDKVRDVQVMRLKIAEASEDRQAIGSFEAYLERRERRLLRRARRKIGDSKPSRMRKGLAKAQVRLRDPRVKEKVSRRLLATPDRLYRTALKRSRRIDASQPASIHDARVAFKRFRYATEVVAPWLPSFPASQFGQMHDYQSLMGDIRDLDMLREALTKFAEKASADGSVAANNMEATRSASGHRQAAATTVFLGRRDEINGFWRAAAERPFPWEAKDDPLCDTSRIGGTGRSTDRTDGRQSAPVDEEGPQADAPGGGRIDIPQDPSGLDPDESLSSGTTDRRHPAQGV